MRLCELHTSVQKVSDFDKKLFLDDLILIESMQWVVVSLRSLEIENHPGTFWILLTQIMLLFGTHKF